jgi:hypothetical protein
VTGTFNTWSVQPTNMVSNANVSLLYVVNYYLNPVNQFAGWNLTYSINSSQWNTNFTSNGPIQNQGLTIPNVSNPIFFETYSNSYLSQSGTFWVYIQGSNNVLYAQSCPVQGSVCSVVNSSSLTGQVSGIANSERILPNGQKYVLTAVAFQSTVGFYYSALPISNSSAVFQMVGNLTLPGNVTDVEFVGTTLAAAIGNTDLELVIVGLTNSLDIDFSQVYSISNSTVNNWVAPSLNATWAPVNIHSSNIYPNRIVVECLNGIYVLGFNYQLLTAFFLNYIPTQSTIGAGQVWNRAVTVFGNYITLLEANSTNFAQISEYALFNVLAATQTKQFLVPNGIAYPLVTSYSQDSRLLYFVGNTNASQYSQYLFAYSVGSTAVNSIYVAPSIPLGQTATNLMVSASSSSFSYSDSVVLISGSTGQIVSWSIPQSPQITVQSQYNSPNNQPYQQFGVSLVANSSYSSSSASIPYSINILNSQELISQITPNIQPITINSTLGSLAFINPGQFFNGTTLSFSLEFNNPNISVITLNKTYPLSKNVPINVNNLSGNITATKPFAGFIFALTYNAQIIVFNASAPNISAITINQPGSNLICTELYVSMPNYNNIQTIIYAYAPCFNANSNNWVLQVATFVPSTPGTGSIYYDVTLPNITYPNNFFAIDPLNYIILDQSASFTNFASGQISIYNSPSMQRGVIATQVFSFGNSQCGLSSSNNFVFAQYGYITSSGYNIFLLDNLANNFYSVQVNSNQNNQYNCSAATSMNLNSVFSSSNLFIPTGTIFTEFYIVNSFLNSNSSNTYYTMVLLSTLSPIYQVNFYLNATNQINAGGVPVIYNNYPGKQLLASSFSRSQNVAYFSVNYINQNATGGVVTAIYNFTQAIFSNINTTNLQTYLIPISSILNAPGNRVLSPKINWLGIYDNNSTFYTFASIYPKNSTVSTYVYSPLVGIHVLSVPANTGQTTSILTACNGFCCTANSLII